jgi:hypothetical protein
MRRSVGFTFVAATLFVALLALNGCAPGHERFVAEGPAGFFWGFWHGAISLITLVVGIWNDSVHVYEVHNTGGWYDFGFLFGVTCALGGGGRGGEHTWRKSRGEREKERRNREEWEEIGRKVEEKLKHKLREWAETDPDESWGEVEKKIESKAREVVKDWANDPSPPSSR